MAGSVNKVIILGNLGRDPEVRTFQNGGKVCNLRVATSERWRDRNSGEQRERTEWHSVAIFNENLVRIAEQYLRKGSKVYVEGQLETRKWQDQSGQDRYSTEVVLRPYRGELALLDRTGEGGGMGGGDGGYDDYAGGGGGGGNTAPGPAAPADMDDEIPFLTQTGFCANHWIRAKICFGSGQFDLVLARDLSPQMPFSACHSASLRTGSYSPSPMRSP